MEQVQNTENKTMNHAEIASSFEQVMDGINGKLDHLQGLNHTYERYLRDGGVTQYVVAFNNLLTVNSKLALGYADRTKKSDDRVDFVAHEDVERSELYIGNFRRVTLWTPEAARWVADNIQNGQKESPVIMSLLEWLGRSEAEGKRLKKDIETMMRHEALEWWKSLTRERKRELFKIAEGWGEKEVLPMLQIDLIQEETIFKAYKAYFNILQG